MEVTPMTSARKVLVTLACAAAFVAGAFAQTVQINGAGATFPYPIYSKWFSEYNKIHPNVEINYQSIGSGGGIRQLTAGTVFFGASDGPMTNDQIFAAGAKIIHLPTVLGGVVPIYEIPGVSGELHFTGKVLAGIFLGKITKWNDPAIKGLNAGVNLPNLDITVVHRSDGSGTSYIWCDYLSKVSTDYKKTVGVATANAPGPTVYPISSFTWLLFWEAPKDKVRGKIMGDFVRWALTDGQSFTTELGYAPLPKEVVALEIDTLNRLKW